MTLFRLIALAIACVAPPTLLAQDLKPDSFGYGAPVVVPSEAAAYRVPVPLDAYRRVVNANLADLRVFNAEGKEVPHGLERPHSATSVKGATTTLPVFPIRGDSGKALDSLRITIESGDTRVAAQAANKQSGESSITSYVLDGRTLTAAVAAFELLWSDDTPDYAGRIRVEASEDLGNWRVVTDGAPIANLRAGQDARLIERRVELPATRSKFWRLSWNAPFPLDSVVAEPAQDSVDVARETFATSGTPVAKVTGEFEFDLGTRAPIDRVNIELPQPSTLIQVELFSRANPKDVWQFVTRGGFYRLKNTPELTNGPYPIPENSHRYWLARFMPTAGGIGEGMPKLQVGFLPHEVVFLARGSAPYTLAYGSADAPRVTARFGSIPEGVSVLRATAGTPHTLGGESRLQPTPPKKEFPTKSAALWAVLLLGVGFLAWMAYRLAHDLKPQR